MESLSLSSPLVVVVVGPPGAGKSFFAEHFADTFGAALVSIDKIRWTLFANHTYSDNENAMVGQIAELMLNELWRAGKTFVIDGGYNSRKSRDNLSRIAKKRGFRPLFIIVQTDAPTAKRRALKRNPADAIDHFKQSLTTDEFAKQTAAYEPPAVDQSAVVISGKHAYASQARVVLKKIVESQGQRPTPAPARPAIVRPRGPFIQ